MAWSPVGRTLAFGFSDGTIRLWKFETRELYRTLQAHSSQVNNVIWSPDGRLCVSSSSENTVRLWDSETGQQVGVLEGHTRSVNSISFSSDSYLLASKSRDNTVRLWRCDTWETVAVLEELASSHWPLLGLAFHPKAPVLATLGERGMFIRIWDLDLGVLLSATPMASSVHYANAFACPECATLVTEWQAKLRLERGFDWIRCNVCETRISLLDREEQLVAMPPPAVPSIDRAADAGRERDTATAVLQGKIETGDFDVFLAHNNADKPQVVAIAETLKQRGLYPWLDIEQIPPGRWFQDVIQQVIPKVKSAAIIIGPRGLGRWQALELRSFISQCVETGLPVIPVLLPGVTALPSGLMFLKELNWVRFSKSIDEVEALDRLEWGITGEHPRRHA